MKAHQGLSSGSEESGDLRGHVLSLEYIHNDPSGPQQQQQGISSQDERAY